MGPGALSESGLRDHVYPLFSRALSQRADRIYLANHSLGRPLDAVDDDVREGLGHWYDELGEAWGAWMGEVSAYRGRIAKLIGCERPDAIVPKTSVAQGIRAVLNAHPTNEPWTIVTTRGEFDSDDAVLKSYARRGRANLHWIEPDSDGRFTSDAIIERIEQSLAAAPGPKLVLVSAVFFVSGQVLEGLDKIIAAARQCDAISVIDSYHAAGAMPVSFDTLAPDFMVGGNYKYTRGGPGACWLAVHPRHLRHAGPTAEHGLATLDTGWFALADPFSYTRDDDAPRAEGGDAWLEATPAILPFYQARSGLEFTLALGLDRLHAYNAKQQDELVRALVPHGIRPLNDHPRGAYVPIAAADGPAAVRSLAERGVDVDARPCPSGNRWIVRFCPDILTTAREIERAAEITADVLG